MSEQEIKEETKEEPTKGLMAESAVAQEEAETQDLAHNVEEAELKKPDFLPDEYWDGEKGTKLEELMEAFSKQEKSYEQLRSKMSRGDHKPPKEYSTTDIGEINADDPLLETYTNRPKGYPENQGYLRRKGNPGRKYRRPSPGQGRTKGNGW
jgi:hypothetical protein